MYNVFDEIDGKTRCFSLISRLPETATLEDIMYELYVLQKHKNAMAAIENGDVFTVDVKQFSALECFTATVRSPGW